MEICQYSFPLKSNFAASCQNQRMQYLIFVLIALRSGTGSRSSLPVGPISQVQGAHLSAVQCIGQGSKQAHRWPQNTSNQTIELTFRTQHASCENSKQFHQHRSLLRFFCGQLDELSPHSPHSRFISQPPKHRA